MPALKTLNIRSLTGKNIVIKNAPLLINVYVDTLFVDIPGKGRQYFPPLESIVCEGCPNLIGFTYDSGSEKFRLLDLRGTKIKNESELSRFQRGVLNTKVLFDWVGASGRSTSLRSRRAFVLADAAALDHCRLLATGFAVCDSDIGGKGKKTVPWFYHRPFLILRTKARSTQRDFRTFDSSVFFVTLCEKFNPNSR